MSWFQEIECSDRSGGLPFGPEGKQVDPEQVNGKS
jgi:hypothetical protein